MKASIKIVITIGIMGIAAILYSFILSPKKPSDEVKWETSKVLRKDINTEVLATGIIKPQVGAEVRIGSRASGTVTDLYVKIGDFVEKGDLLAKLDDAELIAKCKQAKANLNNSKVNLKYTEIELERIKNLRKKDFVSQQLVDDALKAYEMAKAKVEQDKANLEYVEIQLGYSHIHASISGVVGLVSTQKGETVSATLSSPTFVTIIDLNQLEVWAYVDETDIGRIKEDQKAVFTVDTYRETEFNGIVTAIYPQPEIQNNVVNYIVVINIKPQEGKILRPEMTTSVKVSTHNSNNAIAIPNKALKKAGRKYSVYVLSNNQAIKREVNVGLRGKFYTEIKEGLKENELVILNKN